VGDTLSQLIKYEAACRALAECKSVDEAKSWTDKAAAMQAYGRMAKDKTLEVDAAEIRIRAERRLGEMLAASDLQAGGRPAKETGRPQRPVSAPKLADAGISKDLSSRAQKLAAVPAAEFEAELAAKRERDKQDGARVSARLEKAGEKALKSAGRSSTEAPEPAKTDAEQAQDDAYGDTDLLDQLERANAENQSLHEQVKAMSADDQKAETLKWRKAYDNAVRQQSEAMDRAKLSTDREAWTMRQLRRVGKAIGVDDPSKIAPAVEAFMREHKKVAA
jgi:hypothetical protein